MIVKNQRVNPKLQIFKDKRITYLVLLQKVAPDQFSSSFNPLLLSDMVHQYLLPICTELVLLQCNNTTIPYHRQQLHYFPFIQESKINLLNIRVICKRSK